MEPIKFKPLLKQTIWGGSKIVKFKKIDSDACQVGESWEISGVPGSESVVEGGIYAGQPLSYVLRIMKDKLVGKSNYMRFGDEFPLLVKFIDASQDLSVQVHPDDGKARKYGMRNGKTEMWYLMDSEPDAHLFCGLKDRITADEYKAMVDNGTICNAIADYKVGSGDCFFIPSGCIHSIGKGCFLAEIQQTSDATYRIFDFNRKDKNGNLRELHTEKAAECIDFSITGGCKNEYVPAKNQGVTLVECPYFSTAVYDLDEPMAIDYSDLDSFVIFVGIKGEGTFVDNEGAATVLREGEAMLVPATTETFFVSGKIKFLETYI